MIIVQRLNGRNRMSDKKIKVELVQKTPEAHRILALAKNTRLLGGEGWRASYLRPIEEIMEDVRYSLNTIRGPLEFIHYIFIITNASRAMTHQLVRHRVVSFAQQSLRVSKSLDFYLPEGIECHAINEEIFRDAVEESQVAYEKLLEHGADIQDARGILPIATTSAILMKANLRAILELLETRLCLRVQGEFQNAAIQMADLLREAHPWVSEHIGPQCLTKSMCLFPRFDTCPVSKAIPELRGLPKDRLDSAKRIWGIHSGKGIQPKLKGR